MQVAGRSGRADSNGRVVVQTRMKDIPAIVMASKGQVEAFFDNELKLRRDLGFPPFSRMVNLVVRSPKASVARAFAESLASELSGKAAFFGFDVQVYGANECPIEKIRANFRFQVLLRSFKPSDMLSLLENVLSYTSVPSSVVLEIDVDPVDLL